MHYLNHVVIRRRGRSGLNVGDQAWSILVATLCKVHLVSHPGVSALGAVSGFWIVGRGDQFCGRWHLLHIAESGLAIVLFDKLLVPDSLQENYRRQFRKLSVCL